MLQWRGGVYELFEYIPGTGYPQTLESTFDAGRVLSGASFDQLAIELFREVIAVAEGKRAKAELGGYREIAIFKDGVTL